MKMKKMNRMKRVTPGIVMLLLVIPVGADTQAPPVGDQPTEGLTRLDGFIPMYLDGARDRLLFESPPLGEDVLYFVSFATGSGSVELGMDRGVTNLSRRREPGEDSAQAVIRFERAGSRVLVVQRNLRYRALGGPEALAQNIEDSFAQSVLASLPIESEDSGRLLLDATPLFMRDAVKVEQRLQQRAEGTYRFDANRSAFYASRTKSFPRNTEVEVIATYAGDDPGFNLATVTPDPGALTVRIHHSFLQAPTGYRPRVADARIGFYSYPFKDYSTPFDRQPDTRWITRWRLEKQDPTAALSEPKTPIVFYLDPAAPEPARSAIRQGVLWWNSAFELAGFRNAVQVRDPTPDMDPMDIRYSWLMWINRDERGFSSSGQYIDSRTGEVLGAKVRMDSSRIRTIGQYWDAYQPTGGSASVSAGEEWLLAGFQQAGVATGGGAQEEMMSMRQAVLAAHEVGHTFGFEHNFNGSMNDRSSVMEYPTPRVKVTSDGRLDLSDAFQPDIGAYDDYLVRYAYTEFPQDGEQDGLDEIVREMRGEGLLFTPRTDPRWNWYDDLSTPTEYLRETLAARAIMLEHYGPSVLAPGEPLGNLRDMRLWMTYLHHRWAIDAAVKHVGGMYHEFVVKDENVTATQIVPASLQRELLSLLMQAVQPANLALPERLLAVLTPPPYRGLEDLADGYAFDHLRAARILSAGVIEQLLQPDRAARLVAFADRQPSALTLPELVTTVLDNTWDAPRDSEGLHRSLRRVTERVTLDSLMMLGAHPRVTPEVRAFVLDRLARLRVEIGTHHDEDAMTEAHFRQAERDIANFLENPGAFTPTSVAPMWGDRPRSRYPLAPGPPLGF